MHVFKGGTEQDQIPVCPFNLTRAATHISCPAITVECSSAALWSSLTLCWTDVSWKGEVGSHCRRRFVEKCASDGPGWCLETTFL